MKKEKKRKKEHENLPSKRGENRPTDGKVGWEFITSSGPKPVTQSLLLFFFHLSPPSIFPSPSPLSPFNMSKTKVLLVGAAGETGGSIANGLLDTGDFVGRPPTCPPCPTMSTNGTPH
jgi:hypothetical protein